MTAIEYFKLFDDAMLAEQGHAPLLSSSIWAVRRGISYSFPEISLRDFARLIENRPETIIEMRGVGIAKEKIFMTWYKEQIKKDAMLLAGNTLVIPKPKRIDFIRLTATPIVMQQPNHFEFTLDVAVNSNTATTQYVCSVNDLESVLGRVLKYMEAEIIHSFQQVNEPDIIRKDGGRFNVV